MAIQNNTITEIFTDMRGTPAQITPEPEQVRNAPTSAADPQLKKDEVLTEIGQTGTTITQGFLTGVDYNAELTGTRRISEYDKMRLGDATCRAGLLACKLPLLAAEWYIKGPDGKDDLSEASAFIHKQFFDNPTFSWTVFLRQALTLCEYGNAIFEKVYRIDQDGRIGLERFAQRMSKTIHRWTLKDGKSPGVYQILPVGGTAQIPRWKLLYFINEQEGSNYEGISLLRAAHKNWYYKDLYYKVDAIATEKQGVGIVRIKRPPQASQQDIDKAREIAKNMRANEESFIDLPAGFEIDFMQTHADTLKNSSDMVNHHDRQIVKAMLAQFIELGAQQSGSYALSANHSQLFLLGLEYLAKILQEEINHAIRELCDLNFFDLKKKNEYPTLEYSSIGQVDVDKMAEAMYKLATGGLITSTPEIERYILASLKMPLGQKRSADEHKDPDEAKVTAPNFTPFLKQPARFVTAASENNIVLTPREQALTQSIVQSFDDRMEIMFNRIDEKQGRSKK